MLAGPENRCAFSTVSTLFRACVRIRITNFRGRINGGSGEETVSILFASRANIAGRCHMLISASLVHGKSPVEVDDANFPGRHLAAIDVDESSRILLNVRKTNDILRVVRKLSAIQLPASQS